MPAIEGMGFAIPSNQVKAIVEQLIAKGKVTYPFLGVFNLKDVPPEMAQWYNVPAGVYVGGVFPEGPAAKGGYSARGFHHSGGGPESLELCPDNAFFKPEGARATG